MQAWANDLAAYDLSQLEQRLTPYCWLPERRAQLRAELDAYYARLYGLTLTSCDTYLNLPMLLLDQVAHCSAQTTPAKPSGATKTRKKNPLVNTARRDWF